MALDRDQVGLLFNIDVNAMDARQQIELFEGVVEGMAAEVRDQFGRMNTQIAATTRETGKLAQSFGDAASNQLRGFLGQFGMIGDALGNMVPALSGTSAAIAGMTAVTVAAGAAIAGTAMHAMNYTGQIDDLAQVTNLTTETIQSLRLAATLSGQSFEDASQSAVIFQKRIEEAKKGNADLMATFKALGVDLNGPVDQAFRQTLERLGQVADGSTKTATTLELFGKSGAKLLPVMDQVGGSFDNLVTRARDLGIVLDQEAINKSNELADRLDILKLRLSAITTDIGIGAIRIFDDWATAVGRVSITFKQLFTDVSTIVPNLKKLLTGAFLATLPGGSPISLSTLFSEGGGGATGFQGPGIDPVTGLPEIALPGKGGAAAGRGGGAAKAARTPEIDEARIRRQYQAYRAALLAEEQKLNDEREKLRIQGIEGEEAKLRDAVVQMETRLADLRIQAQAAALERSDRAGILATTVANLEAEKALTMQAIEEIETARVQAMMRFVEAANAQTADRLANELEAEQEYLDAWAQAYEDNLARIDAQIQASAARRRAAQEADPSSPLNIFGPAGQAAADRGGSIFEQLGASASSALSTVSQQMGNFGTMMQDVFGGVANGLQNIIQGFILTGRIGGQAFKAMAASIIASLVSQAAVKAIFNVAEGFAALALGMPTTAAKHFTAAKFYGVVAGVAAAASVGMAAIGPGGGEGGQFLAQDRNAGGTMIREQGGRRSSEPQVIIIRAETEPGVMVSKVIQDYKSNGEMRSTLRRDLLGEF